METPICDFIDEYVEKNGIRLHMPGHKGKYFSGGEQRDLTEVNGTDGLIFRSETIAADIFGAARTVYSCQGCTSAIKQMLYLSFIHAKTSLRDPLVFAGRNAHKAFIAAAAEIGFDYRWICDGEGNLLSQNVTPELLDRFITSSDRKPASVYLTSPDYLGNVLDIKGLKKVCEKHGALLLIDNAHGAYLKFLPNDIHPIFLGADMCADSAHKTLPCLTGGAYLHINKAVNGVIGGYIEQANFLFNSTSPSWLILSSLDKLNAYLTEGYRERLADYVEKVAELKKYLIRLGFRLSGNEPLKITISPKSYGYTGKDLAEILRKNAVEPEFCDKDHLTMMFTPENGEAAIEKLRAVLNVEKKSPIEELPPEITLPKIALSARETALCLSEEVSAENALGRIFYGAAVACPPAVPVIVGGEIVDENVLKCFSYYGITKCRVLKTEK